MLSASTARVVAKRSGPATLSLLLVCGVLASDYLPGKIGQRFRTTRGSRQLEDVHDCEAASLDARFFSHASAERLSGLAAGLTVNTPAGAPAAALVAGGAFPIVEPLSIRVAFPAIPAPLTAPALQPFAARPPPQA
jgi:hypothetical protein